MREGGEGGDHPGIWRRRNKEASSLAEVGHVIIRVEEEVLRGFLLEGRLEKIVCRTVAETEELKHLKLPWKRKTCNDEMV